MLTDPPTGPFVASPIFASGLYQVVLGEPDRKTPLTASMTDYRKTCTPNYPFPIDTLPQPLGLLIEYSRSTKQLLRISVC